MLNVIYMSISKDVIKQCLIKGAKVPDPFAPGGRNTRGASVEVADPCLLINAT